MGEPKLVERVAKAIYEADDPWSAAFPWPNLGSKEQSVENYRRIARAAIEAMRMPDTRMLKAAGAAMSPGKRPTQNRVSERAKHGIRYRAMIDAALADNA